MSCKRVFFALCTLILVFGIAGCSIDKVAQKGQEITEGKILASAVGNVVNLEQGWTEDTQEAFYFTDQGSRLMPYAWFLALEQPSSQELFRSDKNINTFRYLPTKPTDLNPDGLPVGFVKDIERNGQEWVGFNCALCHTGQISYKGTDIRIDGGPTLGDIESLQISLVSALKATYEDEQKFDRFAEKVLSSQASSDELDELRGNLLAQIETLANYNEINYDYPHQPHYGFARVDAIGAIFNQVMVTFNDLPENARPSDAPVSYPFIWGTNESDVVQWPGFAPNGPFSLGTLIRNAGEVLGTFGTVDIPEDKGVGKLEFAYDSSLKIENLGKIEKWVSQLRSPKWPEEYLPALNLELAERGKVHYDNHCLKCHAVVSREKEGIPYKAALIAQKEVNTDPKELQNVGRKLKAGKYEGRLGLIPKLAPIPAQTNGLNPLFNVVSGALSRQPLQTIEAGLIEFGGTLESFQEASNLKGVFEKYAELVDTSQFGALATAKSAGEQGFYKARPLDGIWATAPYLHNGSVPNLYELLLPQEQRSKVFYLGSREFDPEKVGYASTSEIGDISPFKFDTSLKGNSNQGHEYGVNELTEDQRKELLEYLKTL